MNMNAIIVVFRLKNYSFGAKGPGSIRGYIGLRFSENLKLLTSCILLVSNFILLRIVQT